MRLLGLVAQSCLTLCNLTDCSPPGSSVHGEYSGKNTGVGCHTLLQGVSHVASRFFTVWATMEVQEDWGGEPVPSPGDLPDPGINPGSPALQVDFFASWATREAQWKSYFLSCVTLLLGLACFSCMCHVTADAPTVLPKVHGLVYTAHGTNKMLTPFYSCLGNPHGWGSLAGYSHEVAKSRNWLGD